MFHKVLNVLLLVVLSAIGGYAASENRDAVKTAWAKATRSPCSCGTCVCEPKCQCGD